MAVGVALCLAAAAYYGMVAPAVQQLVATRSTITNLREQLDQDRALSGEDLRQRLHQAGIFSLEEADSLAADLERIALAAGAHLTNLNIQEPKAVLLVGNARQNRYKVHEVRLKAQFSGNYASLVTVMEAFEKHNPAISLTGVAMRAAGSDSSSLEADLSASIYLLLAEGTGGAPVLRPSAETTQPKPTLSAAASPFEAGTGVGGPPTFTVEDMPGASPEDEPAGTSEPSSDDAPGAASPGALPGAVPPPVPPPSMAPRPVRPDRDVVALLTGTIAGPDGGLAIVQVGRRRYTFKPGDRLSEAMRLLSVNADAVLVRVADEDVTVRIGQTLPGPISPPSAEDGERATLPRVAYATRNRGTASAVVEVAGRTREVRRGDSIGEYVIESVTDSEVLMVDAAGNVKAVPLLAGAPGG